MASQVPFGRTLDADFMFTKLIVADLETSAAFYVAVFGLIEMARVEAKIDGRDATEIVFQPTYAGGPLFILAKFHDTSVAAKNELILGFAAKDLDALIARAEAAAGRLIQSTDVPGAGRHLFLSDPEGHVVQVSQAHG